VNHDAVTAHTQRPPDLPDIPSEPPLLVVLSSPSAAGKDTVRDLLMSWGIPAHFTVNVTTRPRRPGEVDGVDYHFLNDAEFDRLEAEGGLIEHAVVYGQRKGVPRDELLDPLMSGQDVIARVDVQGAATLRGMFPSALLIFIAPPSLEEGQRRLQLRDTESKEEQRLRIEAAAQEMEAAKAFDHVVVNETGKVEATARRIVELIAEEKRRRAAGHTSA
jgi:guanylate kinase